MPHVTVTNAIDIAAPPETVWETLVDSGRSSLWRGADYRSDWQAGSPLRIEGTIGAKRIRDRGTVLRVEPPTLLVYDFLPRISGLPDVPESYSTVTMSLEPSPGGSLLTVTHTVPPSPIRRGSTAGEGGERIAWEIGPESGERHVAFYWRSTLHVLKTLVETGTTPFPVAAT